VTLIHGCGHRYWAVNGITHPTWGAFDWTRLNDGNDIVHSISMNGIVQEDEVLLIV
jgi:hypothetical protein